MASSTARSRPKRVSAMEALRQLCNLQDISEDCSGDEGDSELEEQEENVENIQPVASSDSEESSEEDDDGIPPLRERLGVEVEQNGEYKGNDGTVWRPYTRGLGRACLQNIRRVNEGPTALARRKITDPLSAFNLLLDIRIKQHIIQCTETEARRQSAEFVLDAQSFDKYLALVIMRGVVGGRNQPIKTFWDRKWGTPFFGETMSRNKFLQISRYIRFDIKNDRQERLQRDKFALISEVWNNFTYNCRRMYVPDQNVTIDEQLLATKCRCRFLQYMANKPDKFGIKFWMIVDLDSKYFLHGFPYLGKDEENHGEPLSSYVIKKLIAPYENNGHNITCDNFFSSLAVVKYLNDRGTSLVGTIRKNRREVPKFKNNELYSSLFLKDSEESATLTNYQCKRNRYVLIISSLHVQNQIETDNSVKKKPDTILFYNQTKCGVDVVDQMIRLYSTKAASRRWPVIVFYNILDLCIVNAWILYTQCSGRKISRRKFIFELSEALAANNEVVDAENVAEVQQREQNRKRRQCAAGNCNKNRTTKVCSTCRKPTCGQCTASESIVCTKCAAHQS